MIKHNVSMEPQLAEKVHQLEQRVTLLERMKPRYPKPVTPKALKILRETAGCISPRRAAAMLRYVEKGRKEWDQQSKELEKIWKKKS